MPYNDPFLLEKQKDCLKLYLEHNGSDHDLIELKMRRLGWHTFSRRILHNRNQRGRHVKGWIEALGWKEILVKQFLELGYERVSESSPPYEGGVAAASADGVVLSVAGETGAVPIEYAVLHLENHPPAKAAPLLRKEGSAQEESSPPYEGGVAAASADGVVLSLAGETGAVPIEYAVRHLENHPPAKAAPLLRKEGSAQEKKPHLHHAGGTGVGNQDACAPVSKFHAWLKHVSSNFQWDNKHHRYICEQLAKVDSGEIKRLMIFVPPRHGKSELVTVRYAAWTLKNDPAKNVIIGSYGQSLANRFSRKIKRVLGDDWALTAEALRRREDEEERNNAGEPTYTEQKREHQGIPQCFSPRLRDSAVKNSDEECPFPFVSSRPKNTEAEWETSKGGGLRAVGVGAGVTGFGADLIIVDDPVKSRAEAESKTQREAVWNWFNDDLYTRLEPDGKIILIQTRWHEDDLAGRLLRQMNEGEGEHWDVINLSAIALGAGNAAAPGCNTGSSGVTALGREDREIQQSTFHLTAASDNTGRSIDPKHHHAGGTGVAGEGARVPVKVIGYPRLYSRLAGSAAAPGCNTGSSGVTAPPNEKADQYDPTSYSGSIDPNLHHAGGTGVAGEGTCVPVKDARPPVDQLDRQPGESLWPSRFSIEKLEQRRKQLGTYSFSSLYQQQPVPAEGGMFKREWFGRIISAPPPGLRWIRGYDLGVTATADSDYTASFRVAFDGEGNMYIDGGFRRRMEFPEQRRYILTRLAVEANTEHVIEGTLNGLAVVQAITSERPPRGHLVRAVKVRDPKTSRALEWINIAEQGRLLLVRGAWNEEFIDECCSFPLGTHDDQVDAVSLAVKARRLASNRLHRF